MPLFKSRTKKEGPPVERSRKICLELVKLSMLIAFLSPANFLLANFMLFHPERDTQPDKALVEKIKLSSGATWTDEYFTARDGTKLHGWFIEVPQARKTTIVSHGNAGNLAYRLNIIDALVKSGSSVFAYDYRGYGKSEGEPSVQGIVEDGLSAYDFVVNEKHVLPEDILLYGESLGCAVSTAITKQRPVSGIVLQSGFSTLVEAAQDKLFFYRLYPDEFFPQRFLDNLTAYKGQHPPLLLLHGKNDWILPSKYSQKIFDNASQPKQLVILPNAAHNDVYGADKELVQDTLKSFVQSLISHTVADNDTAKNAICQVAKAAVPARNP